MTELRMSRRAASDLAEIADYTIAEFGIDQAYLFGIYVNDPQTPLIMLRISDF
ncbi:MAG: hypothetical protein QUV08_12950 [Parasphingorhabdus sp.]|nr:hypothetical protein [Parasphingorhabdus sp.]